MIEFLNKVFSQIGDLFRWWVIVAPWERAIRVRLGKHVKEFGAGIHIVFPIIDKIYVQSIRKRMSVLHSQTTTAKDGKVITLGGVLEYEIGNLLVLYNTLHHAEGTLVSLSEAVIANVVNSHNFSEISPIFISEETTKRIDLDRFGINNAKIIILDFAVVKTYRLITGGSERWTQGDILDTKN